MWTIAFYFKYINYINVFKNKFLWRIYRYDMNLKKKLQKKLKK